MEDYKEKWLMLEFVGWEEKKIKKEEWRYV